MTKDKQTKSNDTGITYGPGLVRVPPGTLLFPSLHEMATNKGYGTREYTACLRWEDEDTLQASKAIYDEFTNAVNELGMKHWGKSLEEFKKGVDDGTYETPIYENEYNGVHSLMIRTRIREKAAESKRPQRTPQCYKLEKGGEGKVVPVLIEDAEEIKETFYQGAWVGLKVQLYAMENYNQKEKKLRNLVRAALRDIVFIRDGERVGRAEEGITSSDAESFAESADLGGGEGFEDVNV